MRLIITQHIEKKAEKLGIGFDDMYNFIKDHFVHKVCLLEKLCSPIDETIAYKGYISGVHRIIVFFLINNGIIFPVHIGDKRDPIARNITVDVVRRNSSRRDNEIKSDIRDRKIKIRHF